MRYHRTAMIILALALLSAEVTSLQLQAAPASDPTNPYAILLSAGTIDTRTRIGGRLQRRSAERIAASGLSLWLVQFAGPIQRDWYAALEQTGVRVVTAIPVNAYLVSGSADQLQALAGLATTQAYIQWDGPYEPAYRLAPGMRDDQAQSVEVQLLGQHAENRATLELLSRLSTGPIDAQPVLHYLNVRTNVQAGALSQIASRPDVIAIQPALTPARLDESQGQIVAGNISGNGPAAGDYLAWLAAQGFTQAQFDSSGFVVDIADAGVDNGTLQPSHFALHTAGLITGTGRVAYSRFVGTAGAGATLAGVDGHGTLNAHIISGYVPSGAPYNAFPHADAAGLRYGLGIAPFVQIGASVIFDNRTSGSDYTAPDFEDMVALAYADGARISNNSWGSSFPSGGRAGTGEAFYSFDAQRYDALVRDAQPSDAAVTAPGNQEIVMVFAAGNSGPTQTSLTSPGFAKNVITVGAAEGVRAYGGGQDGSGVGDSGANNLNDVISFSSRGPTVDGRNKPDLVAPGTHITGGVIQASVPAPEGTAGQGFTGFGISGGPTNSPSFPFFPAQQEWYSASSGTSHAAPAVAGGAALLRQWFINRGMAPPSPAMTKAIFLSSARYLSGANTGDTLPSYRQGMGLVDLGRAFSGTPRLLRDQVAADLLTESGQQQVFVGSIADPSQPLRITLAWTDAPGPTMALPYLNNLDLRVQVGGVTYLGNVFSGAFSATGGVSDQRNNAESVFLPAGLPAGTLVIISVIGANVMADGVPNTGGALDQDFALAGSNVGPAPWGMQLPMVVAP
jgi:Subtilase family